MINKKPLIFISNDDGYQANGIRQLIEMLRPLGQLLVMAPDSARSGSSMALTSSVPVKFRKICEEKDLVVFSCSGTPVDCTKLAFHVFFQDEKPDLVVAGINHGDNAAVNVHYSGTMGVTIEGCLKGVPSIAFSSFNKAKDAARVVRRLEYSYSMRVKILLSKPIFQKNAKVIQNWWKTVNFFS